MAITDFWEIGLRMQLAEILPIDPQDKRIDDLVEALRLFIQMEAIKSVEE